MKIGDLWLRLDVGAEERIGSATATWPPTPSSSTDEVPGAILLRALVPCESAGTFVDCSFDVDGDHGCSGHLTW